MIKSLALNDIIKETIWRVLSLACDISMSLMPCDMYDVDFPEKLNVLNLRVVLKNFQNWGQNCPI